jgi:hypothetical protein
MAGWSRIESFGPNERIEVIDIGLRIARFGSKGNAERYGDRVPVGHPMRRGHRHVKAKARREFKDFPLGRKIVSEFNIAVRP